MRVPRIFTATPLPTSTPVSQKLLFELTGSPVNHVVNVLRMKMGENLILFDGSGGQWQAQIIAIYRNSVHTKLLNFSPCNKESPLQIHLGQCISRGERMDYAIRKAVEMGVTEITPLFSERCEVKLNRERQHKKLQHWQQLIISACEQCERNYIPKIHFPCTMESWIHSCDEQLKLVLCHRSDKTLMQQSCYPDSVAVLTGPEGGLSDAEIAMAKKQAFETITLGPRVLRTETAPLGAIAVLQYLWGDWNNNRIKK
ncbi:MAG: 16S rRNA (uracil(1498)-N(3))-methyltransferase [Endozoicomonadaceae bacterium]|nr:16S rRNA (uracil(1498)-N(3))-methyltransferase [Endozoicomonadaceae bacterium]